MLDLQKRTRFTCQWGVVTLAAFAAGTGVQPTAGAAPPAQGVSTETVHLPFHGASAPSSVPRDLTSLLGGPAEAASDSAQRRADALVRAWASGPAPAEHEAGLRSSLPEPAVVERVNVEGGIAAAYLALPRDFLSNLTDLQCETVVRDQVRLLRQIDGLHSFAIYVRPIEDAAATHLPLPAYLPERPERADKPEPDDPDEPGLRSGGLPTYNPGRPAGALSGRTVFLSPGHGWYYSSTLGRWATQRGNSFGIIEDLSNGEAVLLHLARYLHNAGANVWPCRERDFNTNMAIVDNSDSSPSFTTTGSWTPSTGAGSWYGSDYRYHAVSTTETAVASYTPNMPQAGDYAVYVWTPSASNRSTDVTVRVNHTGGTTTHLINMQQDGNTWRFLGMYHFDEGQHADRGSVEISNKGSDPSKFVIADAVRFGGGMGDYVQGGSTSGQPRWEESGAYFAHFMGLGSAPDSNIVRAMPRYARWESESWEDSIYVSWHTNATGGGWEGHGTDIYVYGPNGPPSPFEQFSGVAGSDTLAIYMRDEIVNDLRIAWNDPSWPGNLYTAWFGELDPSENHEMPGVLLEVAFHDSATDAQSILDPRFRDMVSRAVYQAIVKWWYNEHDGPYSSPIPTETLLPEPPTHLAVSNLGDGTVRVSWQAPAHNSGDDLLGDAATGYLVQRSPDAYGFDDGTPTTALSMDFAGLTPGQTWYFRVIATNEGGQSFPSEIGGVLVRADGTSPLLVVNGFDRMDRSMMLAEDDPYDADPMYRERPERMNNYAYIRSMAGAIGPMGVAFDSSSNEAVRDSHVEPAAYQALLWQCGEESTNDDTFDATEQARVQSFLDSGGSIFVSGAEIGWELDYLGYGASFYNNYLKADYAADDAETYGVTTVPGSIFDGISPFSFDDGASIYDVDWPDVLNPSGGSTAALSYSGGTGGTAGVVYDGPFQTVNFGFPIETINSATHRSEVLFAVLDFFGLDPQVPVLPPADVVLESRDAAGAVTPAPAYEEDGAWANSSIKSAAPGLSGTGSRFITYDLPSTGTDNATFVPEIPTPARYEVFVTWANGANCYDARHTVRHYHGQTDLLVDQISSGAPEAPNYDQWISLGQYWFGAGQSLDNASLNISEETVTGRPSPTWNFRVYADAVKWVFVEWWPTGDYDNNGQVDLADFAEFPDCLTGPGGGYANPDCQAFDTNLDGDVDLHDFDGFQRAFAD